MYNFYFQIFFRFGVGKKAMESACLEELRYVNIKIQIHCGKPYNLSVINFA